MNYDQHPVVAASKKALLDIVRQGNFEFQGVRPPDPSRQELLQQAVSAVADRRGRPLYYPFIGSGRGRGPYVELIDGSVKMDFITGIGINLLGHSHPVLQEAAMNASLDNVIMEGNLSPNQDYVELLQELTDHLRPQSPLAHGWFTNSGTMANEIAIKILRQKKDPHHHIVSFVGGFAGRSTMMQQVTDNAKYREGQPWNDEVSYIPYYQPGNPSSLQDSVEALRRVCSEKKVAGAWMELVQGEGGFIAAPPEYLHGLMREMKSLGLGIWVDEIQTFGRTGQLFAIETFGVQQYVDILTVGKCLQLCGCFWSKDYNPKPGLIAGTFMGSVAEIKAALATVRYLKTQNMLGPKGHIHQLGEHARHLLEEMSRQSQGYIHNITALGGMVAFQLGDGAATPLTQFLQKLYQDGVMAFNCGRGPYRVRLLLPAAGMTKDELAAGFKIIYQSAIEFKNMG